MNLNELFPKQQKLDDYIVKEKGLEGQDLLSRKIVALICELYECVNEGRWFKFWSDDMKPRGKALTCINCGFRMKNGSRYSEGDGHCNEIGDMHYHNPLLEEYVDTIHFALSIANDLGVHEHKYIHTQPADLNELVIGITNIATILPMSKDKHHVASLLNNLITLGYQLGFTEQDVIQAYDDKNRENYKRQDNGY